jgi:hypothetical protein
MKTKRKVSLDANHTEIVNGLKKYGYGITNLAASGNGVSDLLVSDGKTKVTVAMEIKTESGRLKLSQIKFLANFKGYSAFVSTLIEAVAVMCSPEKYCLSEKYKQTMMKFLIRWEPKARIKQKTTNPQILVKTFEKEIEKILSK